MSSVGFVSLPSDVSAVAGVAGVAVVSPLFCAFFGYLGEDGDLRIVSIDVTHGFSLVIGMSKPCSMSWGIGTRAITWGHNSNGGAASTLDASLIAFRSSCK